MSVTGDFSGLEAMSEAFKRLSEVPSRAAKAVSADLSKFVEEEFDTGSDPYGRSWAALAERTLRKGRKPPPLTDTGAMRGSVEIRPAQGAGVQISIGEPYSVYHQQGTSRMPARKMLPEGDLPPKWNNAVVIRTREAFNQGLKT